MVLPELGDEMADWLVIQLRKQYSRNAVNDFLISAAHAAADDPVAALHQLHEATGAGLQVVGKPGEHSPSLARHQAVTEELNKQRAREEARRLLAAEKGVSSVRLVSVGAGITDDAPVWAWEYEGEGAIQLGTLGLLAGRPGAGKSTAARWFAAEFSQGKLSGHWSGEPQNVAYIAPAEESMKFVIKPGLRGAGADLDRVFFPEVTADGKVGRLRSARDEDALVEQLLAHDITVVIVDPLMSTIGSGVDIHRNNETREHIEPWARIADRIGGVVLGVVHLRKDTRGSDVVAAITSSSAFGEVARSIFGFAKDPDSDCRIMSQVKNSTGPETLSLAYRVDAETVITDTGFAAQVGKFVIQGNSERTVADVLNEQRRQDRGPTALDTATMWLFDYLKSNGRTPSSQVKDDGAKAFHSESTLKKAAKVLKVVVESVDTPGSPTGRCPTRPARARGTKGRVPKDSWGREGAQ